MKPHKGTLLNWHKVPCAAGIGYYISGRFKGHPSFDSYYGHTSFVVKEEEIDGKIEIETNNSRYTLD